MTRAEWEALKVYLATGDESKMLALLRPEKKRSAVLGVDFLCAQGVRFPVATDWIAIRKAKRLPLTDTAWQELLIEAAKANMTAAQAVEYSTVRSRAGFRASWLAGDAASDGGRLQLGHANGRTAAARAAFGDTHQRGLIDG